MVYKITPTQSFFFLICVVICICKNNIGTEEEYFLVEPEIIGLYVRPAQNGYKEWKEAQSESSLNLTRRFRTRDRNILAVQSRASI